MSWFTSFTRPVSAIWGTGTSTLCSIMHSGARFCSMTSTWKTAFSFSQFSSYQLSIFDLLASSSSCLRSSVQTTAPSRRSSSSNFLPNSHSSHSSHCSRWATAWVSVLVTLRGVGVRLLRLPLSLVPLVELVVLALVSLVPLCLLHHPIKFAFVCLLLALLFCSRVLGSRSLAVFFKGPWGPCP